MNNGGINSNYIRQMEDNSFLILRTYQNNFVGLNPVMCRASLKRLVGKRAYDAAHLTKAIVSRNETLPRWLADPATGQGRAIGFG